MRLTPARLIERIETRHGSLAATERLAAIVNGWASLEHLANRDNRMPGGFNDWEVVQDSGFSRRPAIKQLRSFVARPAIVTALHGVRVAASVVLILPCGTQYFAASLARAAQLRVSCSLRCTITAGTDQIRSAPSRKPLLRQRGCHDRIVSPT